MLALVIAQVQPVLDTPTIKTTLQKLVDSIMNVKAVLLLFTILILAIVITRLTTFMLRRLSRLFRRQADAATDLGTVNRLRYYETWTILSIAIVRLLIITVAIYIWWILTHQEGNKSNAVIGASAVMLVVIGGIAGPLLRDFAFGTGMMAEGWFGVGDLISIDFPKVQGVVERITLRSTRIRGLNGEVIWVANQTISGVKVAQKGVWATAIELFVTDPNKGQALVEHVNTLLPGGLALLVTPLEVVNIHQRADAVWHLTAIGETAPGREWILTEAAINVFKQLDGRSKRPILIVDPVSRYADKDTEREFARAVTNAKKLRRRPAYYNLVKTGKSKAASVKMPK